MYKRQTNSNTDASRQKYIDDVLTLISPVVAELATMFRKIERGEIDLFGNDPKAKTPSNETKTNVH